MNGIHDLGGLHGFGRVEVERDEPVFHAPWEARVFGIVQSFGGGNIDAGRHALEQLDPVAYFGHGYYGRWLAALERQLVGAGVLSEGEIAARLRSPRRRRARGKGPGAGPWRPETKSYRRESAASPAFAVGRRVRTRNRHPAGHTRLPAYARARDGVIQRVHPPMVFPDDHAHGRGESPQHVYTVRFEGRELWGEDAEPGSAVHLDLFESYLEPAPD